MPRLCEFDPGICLKTEEKARKNLSQGKKNLRLRKISVRTQDTYYQKTPQSEYSVHIAEESWCDSFFSFPEVDTGFGAYAAFCPIWYPGFCGSLIKWRMSGALPPLSLCLMAYIGAVSPLY